jgi:hypothetical protein
MVATGYSHKDAKNAASCCGEMLQQEIDLSITME